MDGTREEHVPHQALAFLQGRESCSLEEPRSTWPGESSHLPKTWSVPGSSSSAWHFATRLALLTPASSLIAPAHAGEVTSGMGQWVRGPRRHHCNPSILSSPGDATQ